MKKGNVLVIGNSGVGKSTLINAVLGENCAVTGYGTEGTTKELKIYDGSEVPFRVIDTVGFEPTFIKEQQAINAVKKWSQSSAEEGKEDTQINVIWFCVDGTSRKLFDKAIRNLSRATSMWPHVPLVVVITKSYSVPERKENIEMVHNAFAKQKKYSKNLKKVIPVVAETYVINENAYAPPEGITELIDATHRLMPEGIKAAGIDIAQFKLNRKRALAHGAVVVATTSGVAVGAVPVPFSDAALLGPIEVAEINALAQIYGINKNEASKKLFNSIIEVGTVSAAAKAAISALKAIPGVNIAASVLNAVIAGCIVAAMGEGSIFVFEQIYLGYRSVDDIDWVTKIMESQFSKGLIDKVTEGLKQIANGSNKDAIVKMILSLFEPSKK